MRMRWRSDGSRGGRFITSTALVPITVFADVSIGEMLGINELRLTLGLAAFVMPRVVRCLLVPAHHVTAGGRQLVGARPGGCGFGTGGGGVPSQQPPEASLRTC